MNAIAKVPENAKDYGKWVKGMGKGANQNIVRSLLAEAEQVPAMITRHGIPQDGTALPQLFELTDETYALGKGKQSIDTKFIVPGKRVYLGEAKINNSSSISTEKLIDSLQVQFNKHINAEVLKNANRLPGGMPILDYDCFGSAYQGKDASAIAEGLMKGYAKAHPKQAQRLRENGFTFSKSNVHISTLAAPPIVNSP